MDKERKKELVRQYLETKTPMGILAIKNIKENKIFLETSIDTKSKINSLKLQLATGGCRIRSLQQDWNKLGEDDFIFEVLEVLEYDEDESKKDYSEELKILKMIWEERLDKQGIERYH
jgi:hypothetical protein